MGLAFRSLGIILFTQTLLISSLNASDLPPDKKITYSLGIVPQFEQRKIFRIWQPIVDEVERKTGIRLIIKGSPKIPTFENSFLDGEFDFAYMNPYHITIANKTRGYIPLVRDGSRSLRGIIVVRKDSPITDISQLENKILAFPAPNAIGASLLVRAELSELFNLQPGTKYVQTHSSVYLHVLKELVDAGGGVVSTLNSQRPAIRNNLRIIYQTREIPPHPIAAHPRVPEEHRKLISDTILQIAQTSIGNALFAQIPIGNAVVADISDYSIISDWNLKKYYAKNN